MVIHLHVVSLSLSGHHAPKHILRCENPRTSYVTCPETGRHSIIIPLDSPQGKLEAWQFLGAMMTDDIKRFQRYSTTLCPHKYMLVSATTRNMYPQLNLLINSHPQ